MTGRGLVARFGSDRGSKQVRSAAVAAQGRGGLLGFGIVLHAALGCEQAADAGKPVGAGAGGSGGLQLRIPELEGVRTAVSQQLASEPLVERRREREVREPLLDEPRFGRPIPDDVEPVEARRVVLDGAQRMAK